MKRILAPLLFHLALATFAFALALPASADPQCNYECQEETDDCISMCNEHAENAMIRGKCISICKKVEKECISDCSKPPTGDDE